MILEGIVTTLGRRDEINVAPMGPIVDQSMTTLLLRPFQTSKTFANLKQRPAGVLHVVDDVLLIARAAIGALDEMPETFPAEKIDGVVLRSACRWYEFEVASIDDSSDRAELHAVVVHSGRLRDFFGFNRAKHAVLEAAVLATRVHMLPREEIESQFGALRVPVEKTAGPAEHEAFTLLVEYVEAYHRAG
jgi:hypothetical protein